MAGNNGFAAGIGSANIDLLYSGLQRLPREGEELYAEDFSLQLGGGIPATLITLARLGVKTKIATFLGDDIFSCFAREQFLKAGVSPFNIYGGHGIPLNVTSAMITKNDRTFVSYGRQSIDADDAALEKAYKMCSGAKVVIMHTGSFVPVYKKLKSEGTTLVFDCGWDDALSFEKYGEYLEIADYYTPNQKEALKITGKNTPEDAADALSEYFEKVIVKLDKDGCLGLENGKRVYIPPVDNFKCVDSTGAGDAFLAGFIYGLYCGKSFTDSIMFGNITGGKCVTSVGCLSAYCTENELLQIHRDFYGGR